jgi:hypothetical protein
MPTNGEAGNGEARSGRIAANAKLEVPLQNYSEHVMLTGTAYLYANCRVSTENRNKWAGIIK